MNGVRVRLQNRSRAAVPVQSEQLVLELLAESDRMPSFRLKVRHDDAAVLRQRRGDRSDRFTAQPGHIRQCDHPPLSVRFVSDAGCKAVPHSPVGVWTDNRLCTAAVEEARHRVIIGTQNHHNVRERGLQNSQ